VSALKSNDHVYVTELAFAAVLASPTQQSVRMRVIALDTRRLLSGWHVALPLPQGHSHK